MLERVEQTEKVTEDKMSVDEKQNDARPDWKEALLRTFLGNH